MESLSLCIIHSKPYSSTVMVGVDEFVVDKVLGVGVSDDYEMTAARMAFCFRLRVL